MSEVESLIVSESITSHGLGETDVLDIGLPTHPALDTFIYSDNDYPDGNPMSKKDYKKYVKRECLYCGIIFPAPLTNVRRGFGLYCSRSCGAKTKNGRIYRICKQCRGTFDTAPKSRRSGFCSPKCRRAWWVDHQITGECETCGKTSIKPKSAHEGYKHFFCSDKCRGVYYSGPRCHLYKDGSGYRRYKHKEWDYIRDAVIERDKVCQLCGENGNRLSAHHMLPHVLLEEHRIDGCITLCNPCHSKIEHRGVGWFDFRGVKAYA